MSAERWLPVVGYEGLYEVSDHGRVRSLDRVVRGRADSARVVRGRVLTPRLREDGHLDVSLWRENVGRNGKVHRLVMAAFEGPCPAGLEVLHGDGNGLHNERSNLRYGTRAENIGDCIKHGTHNNASKVICSRGHRLTGGNMTRRARHDRNERICVACDRSRHVRVGESGMSRQERADLHYAEILERAA